MGRRVIDQATWDKLLAAYREQPGVASHAARSAGVTRPTAQRAWDSGWPKMPYAKVPISKLIDLERDIARSRMELEDEAAELADDKLMLDAERDRERSRQQAIRSREDEAKLVQAARVSVIMGLASAVKLGPAMQAVMQRMATEMTARASTPDWTRSDRDEALAQMRRFATILQQLNSAGQTAMEMERLFMGEPEKVIGIVHEFESMPMEELMRAAGYTDGILRRAAARGLVGIDLPNGKANGDGKIN